MRRAGLEGGDTSLLLDAVATLETEATDSDMDGAPDVEEIRAGTDPNAAQGKLACYVPEPEEGCRVFARPPASAAGSAWGLGALLSIAAVVRMRRRWDRRGLDSKRD